MRFAFVRVQHLDPFAIRNRIRSRVVEAFRLAREIPKKESLNSLQCEHRADGHHVISVSLGVRVSHMFKKASPEETSLVSVGIGQDSKHIGSKRLAEPASVMEKFVVAKDSDARVDSIEDWTKAAKPMRHSFIVVVIELKAGLAEQPSKITRKGAASIFDSAVGRDPAKQWVVISYQLQGGLGRVSQMLGRLIRKSNDLIIQKRASQDNLGTACGHAAKQVPGDVSKRCRSDWVNLPGSEFPDGGIDNLFELRSEKRRRRRRRPEGGYPPQNLASKKSGQTDGGKLSGPLVKVDLMRAGDPETAVCDIYGLVRVCGKIREEIGTETQKVMF